MYPVVVRNALFAFHDGFGDNVVLPAAKENFLVRGREVDSC